MSPDPDLAPPQGVAWRAEAALRGIYEIARTLGEPGRLDGVLAQALRTLSDHAGLRRSVLALLDEKGAARAAIGIGMTESDARAAFEALPRTFVLRVVASKRPVVIEVAAQETQFAAWAGGAAQKLTLIGAPIRHGGEFFGLLAVDRVTPAGPSTADEDANYLAMVAGMIGQTLHLYDVVTRDRERMMDERRRLEKDPPRQADWDQEHSLVGIVGASPAIRAVFNQINIVARTHTTLLLRGESGTGKELFARAAHDLSPRKDGPFIRLNCAALPEATLESELFGHEKGAFTGAIGQRKGRFELADGGTLFLDEIGEISPAFQAKLLRVLQEGEFERVGGSETLKVDVRFVFATNRNLEAAVERGAFRADLYYRINVVTVALPPLRERGDDTALLAQEFLRRYNEENNQEKQLSPAALRLLQGCYFPGNVRELENCVRRTATMSRDERIVAEDFACMANACLSSTLWKAFGAAGERGAARPVPARPARDARDGDANGPAPDRDALIDAMERAGWVQAKAARLLNLTPRQIAYALSKHRIAIKKF